MTAMFALSSNLILLNLLIAMFSQTFTKIDEKSELRWGWRRGAARAARVSLYRNINPGITEANTFSMIPVESENI